MEKKIFLWQILGAIFIIFVGSFFHFLFEISGYLAPIGAIAPVNESVWEHLKLGYYPLLIFALIEYKFLKKSPKQFIIAIASSAIIIPLIIVVFFYSYTAILGEDLFILDILSFVLAAIIGQLVSYKVLVSKDWPKVYYYLSVIFLIAFGIIFVLFTYFTPELPIFQDPITLGYGIVVH
jgi:hypothetical protein